MTDYNDGRWHGWNSGKMPVHAMSEVECLFSDGVMNSGLAKDYSWQLDADWIAFRVIKLYREPREFTLVLDKWGHVIGGDDFPSSELAGHTLVKVREVLPD